VDAIKKKAEFGKAACGGNYLGQSLEQVRSELRGKMEEELGKELPGFSFTFW
jgi:hypothetical protein